MQESIAITWSTLTARLKNLRAGAAAAGLALALLIVLGLWLRTGWVWAGLPVLAAIGYAAFARDQRLVFSWEDRVLALWGTSDLCMGILVQTLSNHPTPLNNTLKSMIAFLPENEDYLPPAPGVAESQRLRFWTRAMLAEARLHRAAALNLALACLPFLLWFCARQGPAWLALAGLPLVVIPPSRRLALALARRRWDRRRAAIASWQPASSEESGTYLDGLDWSRLPPGLKPAVAAALATAPGNR